MQGYRSKCIECVYTMCVRVCVSKYEQEGRPTWRMSAYRSHCSVCCARCLETLWPPSKLVACNNFENLLMTAAVPQAKGNERRQEAKKTEGSERSPHNLWNFATSAAAALLWPLLLVSVAAVASTPLVIARVVVAVGVAVIVAFKCDSYEHVRFS